LNFQQIGKHIRTQRKLAKLTQEQLADRAHLSPAYLSHVEHGRKNISLMALLRIAKALEIPADRLLESSDADSTSHILTAINELLAECSSEDQKIIFEVARTLKSCLQKSAP